MDHAYNSALAIPVTRIDHARGAEQALVTIVQYGDFECPHCRAAEPALRQLLEQHPTTVRLVYRHFPLEALHPHALLAAEAAEAAAAEGQFWAMHDLLMQEGARLDRAALDGYALMLRLNGAQFSASLSDEIYRQRIREQMSGATRSHVSVAPTFFINGHQCDTAAGVPGLADAVQLQLAGHLRLSGANALRSRPAPRH